MSWNEVFYTPRFFFYSPATPPLLLVFFLLPRYFPSTSRFVFLLPALLPAQIVFPAPTPAVFFYSPLTAPCTFLAGSRIRPLCQPLPPASGVFGAVLADFSTFLAPNKKFCGKNFARFFSPAARYYSVFLITS